MRILIEFNSISPIKIPVAYNYYFQSAIYRLLSNYSIHKEKTGSRNYKFFTFSRPIGDYEYLDREKVLVFKNNVKWIVSALNKKFLEELIKSFLDNESIKILNQELISSTIKIEKMPDPETFKNITSIKMLSPVTTYSTLYNSNKKRKTYYYSPFEKDFSIKIKENLLRKFKSLYKKFPKDNEFEIKAVKPKKEWEKIVNYKGTVIKGWMGRYKIKGNPELIELAYDTGLGSKNSQGFGCFEIEEIDLRN